ncbi:acetyl-CoA synthetase-like protein, partial [Hesseltinella vesiculosa]
VSILSDQCIDFPIWIFAFLRLKVTTMCMSPRNSAPAMDHLLKETHCTLILAHPKYGSVASEVAQNAAHPCHVLAMEPLDMKALTNAKLDGVDQLPMAQPTDTEEISMIIHSSGSTNFPKPIHFSDRYVCYISTTVTSALDEHKVPYDSHDLFHLAGLFPLMSCIRAGFSLVLHETFPPTVDTIFKTLHNQKVTGALIPPIMVEHMVMRLQEPDCPAEWNNASSFQHLKNLMFGGAPVKDNIAAYLTHHTSMNLCSLYGSTEINGFMAASMVDPQNVTGLRPLPTVKDYVIWEDAQMETRNGEKLYHLAVKGSCPTLATGVTNRPDGGFDSNDLFIKSEFPSYYKYFGRRDDTIVFENGEKTNPIPMEATFRECPIIDQAVVCGSDRPATLALVQLNIDEAMKHTPHEIIQLVHNAANKVNEMCPNHAKVLKQLIYILPFNSRMPSTDKGTAKRKLVMAQFADTINQLYDSFSKGSGSDDANEKLDGKSMSAATLKNHLIQATADVMEKPASFIEEHSDDSLFDYGLNSLLITQLRNRMLNWFDDVPQNLMYKFPTINSLVNALQSTSSNNDDPTGYEATKKLTQHYKDLAYKDFEVIKAKYPQGTEPVYLLTGVTGSIGSFTLEDLLTRNKNTKVYCLVRAKTPAAATERLVKAFHDRQLNTELLHQALANKNVQAFPMNLDDDMLGFSEQQFNQLKSEITIILHSAWLLDFNQPLEHFDRTCIQGMYRLLKFAYRGPSRPAMHIHTLSSVSATCAWISGQTADDGTPIIPESILPDDPSKCAMPIGYAESKFLCEHLFHYLATEKNFPAVVERVGQICGDTKHGVWNYTEQFSLMFVGGAGVMHKMPDLDMLIDWLPVDYAARAINEIMSCCWDKETNGPLTPPSKQEHNPFHVVNPQRTNWAAVLEATRACGLEFETVPLEQWTEALSKDDTNPAYRLLSFFSNLGNEASMPIWSTKHTSLIAPSLTEASPVSDKNLLQKFITYWRQV